MRDLAARISWIEVAIAGVTGGIIGASALIGAKLASDPGDVLGFFGSAVGAGLAILGARWLENKKRSERDADRINTLWDAVDFCIRACASFQDADQQDRMHRLATYEAGLRMLSHIKQTVVPPDFTVVLWFDSLESSVALAKPAIWDGAKLNSTEEEVAGAMQAIELVGRMLVTIQATLDARRAGKRFGDAIERPNHGSEPLE